jgi:hypothetical protein
VIKSFGVQKQREQQTLNPTYNLDVPNKNTPQKTKQPGDISRWFTLVGIVCGFLSTFFAHGFLTLARQAIQQGKAVKRSYLVSNLLRNTNINLLGIGITLVGLQASGARLCCVLFFFCCSR